MPDELFDALADGRRRRFLWALAKRDLQGGESSVADASELTAVSTDARFYHVHLPKLADAGLVEWDRGTDEIARGPRFEHARRLLELAYGRRDETFADA